MYNFYQQKVLSRPELIGGGTLQQRLVQGESSGHPQRQVRLRPLPAGIQPDLTPIGKELSSWKRDCNDRNQHSRYGESGHRPWISACPTGIKLKNNGASWSRRISELNHKEGIFSFQFVDCRSYICLLIRYCLRYLRLHPCCQGAQHRRVGGCCSML